MGPLQLSGLTGGSRFHLKLETKTKAIGDDCESRMALDAICKSAPDVEMRFTLLLLLLPSLPLFVPPSLKELGALSPPLPFPFPLSDAVFHLLRRP